MTDPQPKPDNLLGICHAIGNDFGFDPIWLRIALACVFLFAPLQVVTAYLALGAIVLLSRLVAPTAPRLTA